jgi:hypothetical protein
MNITYVAVAVGIAFGSFILYNMTVGATRCPKCKKLFALQKVDADDPALASSVSASASDADLDVSLTSESTKLLRCKFCNAKVTSTTSSNLHVGT